MSEKIRGKKNQYTMYTQSLSSETIYEYKLLGLLGYTLRPYPLDQNSGFGSRSSETKKGALKSWNLMVHGPYIHGYFQWQSMSIGSVGKLRHLFCSIRHTCDLLSLSQMAINSLIPVPSVIHM